MDSHSPTTNTQNPSERPTKAIILLTFFSALGGFLFGYDTGVVSGAMLLLRRDFQLTNLWQEIIVSITIVSAWGSSLIGGVLADRLGRKRVILGSSFVFTLGAIVLGLAPNKETLLAGRFIVGLGIGSSSMCVPVYLSEVAPLSIRGRLTVTNTLFITGGQFIASVICGLFGGMDQGWRWMLGIGALPSMVQLVAFFFAPESPRWLSLHGRYSILYIIFLYKNAFVISDVIKLLLLLLFLLKTDIAAIFQTHPVRRALILGCLLQLFQQISGINTVMYYSASIIAMAGIDNDQTAIWLAAVTSFFNFSFTFVGLWLVERLGRRLLTLGSLFGVTLALLTLGLSFQLTYNNSHSVTSFVQGDICSQFKTCSHCTENPECGFCFGRNNSSLNTYCLQANHSLYNEDSITGPCVNPEESGSVFAYNWCPSGYSWISILGLCLYLCFFAPGMGPMPWSVNSEIYPNWARARCTSYATSVNWGANLIVSLTFLTLTEAITKQGTFYLYTGFALSGFIIFFLILPETKGVHLENVESLFQKPLLRSTPWKTGSREELTRKESYGTLPTVQ
ncbi:Proton myo-inositol cotransporter [Armadillidium nasatum]|uniref:Proton myo-inositol cotransporter n=1 Tax=Armadillidium nasatum TaxID=96803 RepID=A0A5N5TM24_9CRUS|nr:Proton myo-inositol cotransporter [Armadillidium nasatum]